MSIDAKIDDGLANLGKIRGINPGAAINGGGTCYAYSASAGATYITTSSSTKVCGLTYQVDVNS